MKHSVIFIAFYLATVMVKIVDIDASGNTTPTKIFDLGNGRTVTCKIRSKKDECWFDHHMEACDTDGEMLKCVPCKPGYRNCVRSSSEFDVKCYRPEHNCQPEEILVVTELGDGGCSTKCICNKTAGYIRRGSECIQHPTPCGINSTLQDGMCTGCPAGTYKPWVGFQDCMPVPKPEKPVAISARTQKQKNHSGFENEAGVADLQPPKHLTAKAISNNVLFFQWYKPGPVVNYTMFLADYFGTYDKKVDVIGTDEVMNVTIMNLKPSTIYTAYVTAVNNQGASAKSETVNVATMNNDLELEAKEDVDKSGNGGGTDTAVITGVTVSLSVVFIIAFVLAFVYLRKRGKLMPSTNVIYNVINQFVIRSGSLGQQPPSHPPPPYYPHPDNSVVAVDTDQQWPLAQCPSLNSSSLLGGQHQSSGRTSLGADSVAPKEYLCDASVQGDAASQTSRKVPFPSQRKEEERALLQEGGSCSEFGPQAMEQTGTK